MSHSLFTARCMFVKHGLDYNHERLEWWPDSLYRTRREARPIPDTGPMSRPFWKLF
ncbi:hypothetical protein [Roseibium sp. RKSG952]|uniref:hypothetical protein n=1 Tax=Roseibium sp. RKSG952 TaxID=2529384 RepID=UPI0012BC180F|nr:hypothetical protein [Roseibium sp. RKSG952]